MRERGQVQQLSPLLVAVPAPAISSHDAVTSKTRHPSAGRNVPAGAEWSLRHRTNTAWRVDILYANVAPNFRVAHGLAVDSRRGRSD